MKKMHEAEAKLSAQGQNDSMREQTPDSVSHSVFLCTVPPQNNNRKKLIYLKKWLLGDVTEC